MRLILPCQKINKHLYFNPADFLCRQRIQGATQMILVVTLTVSGKAVEKFEAFETEAVRIMAKYGGAIEKNIRMPAKENEDSFQEVHVLYFPGEREYAAYRSDNE